MANIGGGRILRVCDLCGGVDDHPRHVIAGQQVDAFASPSGDTVRKVLAATADLPQVEQDRLLGDLVDTTSSDRHLDCCAAAGCPTGTCGPQVEGVKGKTGKAMLTHVMALKDLFADRSDVVKAE